MTFIAILSIFVLACFVGYYVVWSVTPALHTPLMAVTNAISSVIVVGALIAGAASEARNALRFSTGVVAVPKRSFFGAVVSVAGSVAVPAGSAVAVIRTVLP